MIGTAKWSSFWDNQPRTIHGFMGAFKTLTISDQATGFAGGV